MKPKVMFSILIPNLGFNAFFCECLQSAITQVTNGNFEYEIIILDQSDNSDFNSIKDVVSAAACDYCKLVHTSEKGLFKARHTLMTYATGSYIVFLDSDDFLNNNYLLSFYQLIINKCFPDVVIKYFYSFNSKTGKYSLPYYPRDIDSKNIKKYFLHSSYFNSVCIKVFKKDLYDIDDYSNINFDITNGEDFFFSLPIMEKAKSIQILDDNFRYYYRINSASMTHSLSFEECVKIIGQRDFVLYNNHLDDWCVFLNYDRIISFFVSSSVQLIKKGALHKAELYSYCELVRNKLNICKLKDTSYFSKKHRWIYKRLISKNYFLVRIILLIYAKS